MLSTVPAGKVSPTRWAVIRFVVGSSRNAIDVVSETTTPWSQGFDAVKPADTAGVPAAVLSLRAGLKRFLVAIAE
jgi:hypothetical protein